MMPSKEHKVALITGITGQDGSYLTELLLSKGYTVHGIIRYNSTSDLNTGGYIDHIYKNKHETAGRVKLFLHYGDLCDATSLKIIIGSVRPTEIYNLGAMSQVHVSFVMPAQTANCDGLGVLRMLDAIRACGLKKEVKFYQASSSELYGKVREVPQSETTPFCPRSPYAVAKQYAFWILVNYREAYGMKLFNGILFNHESPRRGRSFVTRKITSTVANIYYGKEKCLYLGNIDVKRDWGHARDFVEGMWRMMQENEADDYVLATGENHSVREFVEKAFQCVGITIAWKGTPGTMDEIGVDADHEDRVLVRLDPSYFRPTEVNVVLGNPTKAKLKFGWVAKTNFDDLVKEMMTEDLKIAQGGAGAGLQSIASADKKRQI
mmetsp:Transcript_7617/g.14408  ORF Transcript_7617/g.14408 Transcript_7617/m.14408 type:complete len:378 (+) Transcript_7617:339-1472(+)